MSNKALRNLTRVVHLIAGISLFALVYSDVPRNSETFLSIMQVVIVPVVVLSGMIMWQQPAVSRLLRRFSEK